MTTTLDHPAPAPSEEPQVPPKPLLRGWLHLCMAPVALICGLLLTAMAPTLDTRIASAVYTLSAVLLFGTSAVYHRGNWSPRALAVLRRMDHSNIFVFIAGTYTPLAFAMLEGSARWLLVGLVWTQAVLGVAFRLLWLGAPRWLYTVLYIAMGWTAVWWLPQFWATGGPAVVVLLIVGGVIYSLGAVAYATKRPQLSLKWFGFHEVFHTATILAALCHLIAIWIAILSL